MPNIEPVVIGGIKYTIRHVGIPGVVWPRMATPLSPEIPVLAQTLTPRPLPMSDLPNSPDFVSGSWTGRLGDAGELQLQFPNKEASDGVPWRQRFDPTGHLQFIEIWCNEVLESACVIDTVQVDQQQITVHGQDGWFLLKKAYERDWIVVESPRDIIERGTQVWVPTTVDNFPGPSLASNWTVSGSGGGSGSITIGQSGGAIISTTNGHTETLTSSTVAVAGTGAWSTSCQLQSASQLGTNNGVSLVVTESGSNQQYALGVALGIFTFDVNFGSGLVSVNSGNQTPSGTVTLSIESDGEWVSAYVNGALVGTCRRTQANTTSLSVQLNVESAVSQTLVVTLKSILVRALQPFLMIGDKGDYVLPGNASTFPNGGLHARYYNDLDLQADANRLYKILAPPRSQAYGGSTPAEYQNQQDAQLNFQANPTPGAATTNWSAKWFGAIYLELANGNYTFQIQMPITGGSAVYAVRVWVGQTAFGTQLVDQWTFASQGSNYNFTVNAATLEGNLGYGQGFTPRNGWYPIKIEYAVDAATGATSAPKLVLTNSPIAYTDPGGTAIAQGVQTTVMPATSFSPLGCVDNRYQGQSHYDLVQQTVQAYDYQAAVEPKQLESGSFPGVLAPRIREGHDTDIILAPDTGIRQDGEGLLNYSSTLDATDYCSDLFGNGAGFQTGTVGQLQGEVYDPATMMAALFAVQGWQDFSDAAFIQLLDALLNGQISLQLTPWQLLSADPAGRNRLAYTWPLTGAIEQMLWRPGDGMRVQARNINVFDTSPRQMLVFTRNILPNAITSATASFADRPKNQARTLRQQLRVVSRPQRNYQRQLVTLNGVSEVASSLAAGATDTGASVVGLLPSDQIVAAYVRVAGVSGTSPSWGLNITGTDQTTVLGGPWAGSSAPTNVNIKAVATSAATNIISAQLINKSATNAITAARYQLFVDVLR